jgi:flagellar hook-basal body complex protein FliE
MDGCRKSHSAHTKTEEKSGNENNSFYEDLEQVFEQVLKNQKKLMLRDFSAKLETDNIFTPTTGNGILQENSNENGGTVLA